MSRRPEWWLSVLAKLWPLTWISAEATHWPVVGRAVEKLALPLFSGDNLNVTYIPINRRLHDPESSPLPIRVGEELIQRSSHRAIIKRCTCRDARQCTNHPIDFGCTLLGRGAAEIDPRIARHVTRKEAIAHLHRTVAAGLVPMAGRVRIDNTIWGVADSGKLLTICHCCHCCCTVLTSGKHFPETALDALVPLKGLVVRIDFDRCKGCGRCVSVCPEQAIGIDVENVAAAIDELVTRIGRRIELA
jgi:Pyruvate/2-oxoacid:ferredoxin oxidoreductase delta subunit